MQRQRDGLVTLDLGIVLETRPSRHRWGKTTYRVVDLLPGAPPADWKLLREQDGVAVYHMATLPLHLHRRETEAYRLNLASDRPAVFTILRPRQPGTPGRDYHAYEVTVSAYEGQHFLDCGDDMVEAVPMPAAVRALVEDFIDRHHVDEAFKKRKRDAKALAAEEWPEAPVARASRLSNKDGGA